MRVILALVVAAAAAETCPNLGCSVISRDGKNFLQVEHLNSAHHHLEHHGPSASHDLCGARTTGFCASSKPLTHHCAIEGEDEDVSCSCTCTFEDGSAPAAVVTTELHASITVQDETVESFDETKKDAFKASVAATLGVHANDVTLTVRSADERRRLSESDGAGLVIDIIVRLTGIEGAPEEAALASAPAEAQALITSPTFVVELAQALQATEAFAAAPIDAANLVVDPETVTTAAASTSVTTTSADYAASLDGTNIWLQSVSNGRFLRDADGAIACNGNGDGGWERFTVVHDTGAVISLRSHRAKVITAAAHGLVATTGNIQGWEKFTLNLVGTNTVTLKTRRDTYVSAADDGSTGQIATPMEAAKFHVWAKNEACDAGQYRNAQGVCTQFAGTCANGSLETQQKRRIADNQCGSCDFGYYLHSKLCWPATTSEMYARTLDGMRVNLQISSNGRYITAMADGDANAEGTNTGGYKTHLVHYLGGRRIRLESTHGTYLQANGGGGVKWGSNPGAWESFDVTKTGEHTIMLESVHGLWLAVTDDHDLHANANADSADEMFVHHANASPPTACNSGYYRDTSGDCTAWGGVCMNGVTANLVDRTGNDQCGSCNLGYMLENKLCVHATTSEDYARSMDGMQVHLQLGSNGRFIQARPDGDATAAGTNIGGWETHTVRYVSGTSVRIESGHGTYLQAMANGHVKWNSNPGAWEKFSVTKATENAIALQSYHGLWLEVTDEHDLNAGADAAGAVEVIVHAAGTACNSGYYRDTTTGECTAYGGSCVNGVDAPLLDRTSDNQCASCDFGYYLFTQSKTCVEAGTSEEYARALDGLQVNLKVSSNGRFIAAMTDGDANAAGTNTGGFKTHTVQYVGGTTIRLRSTHGTYLQANSGGGVRWSSNPGAWEAFDITKTGSHTVTLEATHHPGMWLAVTDDHDLHANANADSADEIFVSAAGTACNSGYYRDANGDCTAYGGGCVNGDDALLVDRTGENQCSSCDFGYYLHYSKKCVQASTSEEYAQMLEGRYVNVEASSTGLYLVAHPNGDVSADGTYKGGWKTHLVHYIGGTKIALESTHGKYMAALPWGDAQWGSTSTNTWEQFELTKVGENTVKFQSVAHDKWLTVTTNNDLKADGATAEAAETFQMHG